jgi:hypothetical protein
VGQHATHEPSVERKANASQRHETPSRYAMSEPRVIGG